MFSARTHKIAVVWASLCVQSWDSRALCVLRYDMWNSYELFMDWLTEIVVHSDTWIPAISTSLTADMPYNIYT